MEIFRATPAFGCPTRAYCPPKQVRMDVAIMNDRIESKILRSAFESASLIDLLRSPGQYTVCTSADAAFKRLPAGSLDVLFKNARTLKPFPGGQSMGGALAANDLLAVS